jgi:hypothetical protein
MYGPALTSPTNQLSRTWLGAPCLSPLPIPNSWGKDKFAPLDPV